MKRKRREVRPVPKATGDSGFIFDIKHFAVHDGPGIRTTIFLKGCPLHCLWCHNPEGISFKPDLMVRSSRCSRCYACIPACPRKAISKGPGAPISNSNARLIAAGNDSRTKPGAPPADGPVVVDRSKCDLCGKCAEVCMYEALAMAGRVATVAEVVAEVEKDRIFYDQSGGGATLSGGEPLSQLRFTVRLLAELKARKIHAALDTSGFASWESLWKAASLADLVLYDLKMVDAVKHAAYTAVPNRIILENLRRLAASGLPIAVRIPLAAGVNDGPENIRQTIELLKPLPAVRRIDILRYHQGGREKYKNLGQSDAFEIYDPPSAERMEEIRRDFAAAGFKVTIGG